jgi:Uncharacterized conserved protein
MMEQIVPAVQKKAFIKWFLEQRLLGNREIIWLFNYLMGDETILGIVHFVESVEGCRRAIDIHAAEDRVESFRYIKGTVMTNDPEKAFHDLRLDQVDAVYISLKLKGVEGHPEYYAVLEDRPDREETIHETFGKAAEEATGAAERAYAEERLRNKINQALDHGDKTTFYQLSAELRKMKH